VTYRVTYRVTEYCNGVMESATVRWNILRGCVKTLYDGKTQSDRGNGDLNRRGFSLCAAPSLVESGVR
jgi:hypothetical protein